MVKRSTRYILLAWLLFIATAVAVVFRTHFVADLSAFLPKSPNVKQQILVEQLKEGAIARLVLIGIEGGDATQRADASRQLQSELSKRPLFSVVQNGDPAAMQADQAYYFKNRYLLSPAVEKDHFSEAGIKASIQQLLIAMSGDSGLLIKKLLPSDPTGETLQILEQFMSSGGPRMEDDVWVSKDGQRAVLMAQLASSGLNTDEQALALDDIRAAFTKASQHTPQLKLVMTGTAVFSVYSRDTIKSEVERLATLGTVLVIVLLLLVYRSFRLLLLGVLPVASGALAGIAAVSIGFGYVHGLTLGFGTTLIGEAVDYSIYLFIQSGQEKKAYFWRTIRLGVLASIAGFAVLMVSSFPGLSQLGVYSIAGLLVAVLVTRFVLPVLMPTQLKMPALTGTATILDHVFEGLRRIRWVPIVLLVVSFTYLLMNHQRLWSRQLSSLSTISAAQSQLDAKLRGDFGNTDMRYIVSFHAPTQEAALQKAETVSGVLNQLVAANQIQGFQSPSNILPSVATQQKRLAAIPDQATLVKNLNAALVGMPVSADKLTGFVAAVTAAKQQGVITKAGLAKTASGVLLDSMLIRRADDYLVMMPLVPLANGLVTNTFQQSLDRAGLAGVSVLDVVEETSGVFGRYTEEAMTLSLVGSAAIVALFVFSKGWRTAWRISFPLLCAVVVVMAIFAWLHIQMTILHLVGLLLLVAIGSNYVLFFAEDETDRDLASRQKMEVSLVVANLATVCSFGLLGTSSVPVLSFMGSTVGIGTFLALIFAAMLVRQRYVKASG